VTCRVGEEDKLAREGSEERRIMGLRRESLIFHSSSRYIAERLSRQRTERRSDRKRQGRQIGALHAPHIEEEFSHTHTHTHADALTHTHTLTSDRRYKVCIKRRGETNNTL